MKFLISFSLLIIFTAISGFSIGAVRQSNDIYQKDAVKNITISNVAAIFHLESKDAEENELQKYVMVVFFSVLNLILMSKFFCQSLNTLHFKSVIVNPSTRKSPRISYLPPPKR